MFRHLTDITKALVFYSIAFGLAVLVALLAPLLGPGAAFLTMFAPLIAVLLMLLVVTRDSYSRAGWRALGLHRAGLRGWPLALLGPVLVLGCTYALAWRIGVGRFVQPAVGTIDMVLNLLINLAIGGLLGGLGEEIGWRGYFLPHLLTLGRQRPAAERAAAWPLASAAAADTILSWPGRSLDRSSIVPTDADRRRHILWLFEADNRQCLAGGAGT